MSGNLHKLGNRRYAGKINHKQHVVPGWHECAGRGNNHVQAIRKLLGLHLDEPLVQVIAMGGFSRSHQHSAFGNAPVERNGESLAITRTDRA